MRNGSATNDRSSSTNTHRPVAILFRDALLRLVFRMFVTERSLEWMYGHRVGWDERVA